MIISLDSRDWKRFGRLFDELPNHSLNPALLTFRMLNNYPHGNIPKILTEPKKQEAEMVVKSWLFIGMVVLTSGCQRNESRVSPTEPASASASAAAKPVPSPVAAVARKSYEGPFGLAMGILPAELTDTFGFKNTPDRPSQFDGSPPKPVPDFDSYFAMATPGQGICILGALQQIGVVNATGDQLRERVDNVAEMLKIKYGEYTEKIDFANQDVYRRNSQFWMMALTEGAREYAYSWRAKRNKTLPNNIRTIEVFARAHEMNSGVVVIKYYFENEEKCQAEKRVQKAANL